MTCIYHPQILKKKTLFALNFYQKLYCCIEDWKKTETTKLFRILTIKPKDKTALRKSAILSFFRHYYSSTSFSANPNLRRPCQTKYYLQLLLSLQPASTIHSNAMTFTSRRIHHLQHSVQQPPNVSFIVIPWRHLKSTKNPHQTTKKKKKEDAPFFFFPQTNTISWVLGGHLEEERQQRRSVTTQWHTS